MQPSNYVKMRSKIDNYFYSTNIDYREGKSNVQVKLFFRDARGYNGMPQEGIKRILRETGRNDESFTKAVYLSAHGRPSFAQIRLVTQEVIDKRKMNDIRIQNPGLSNEQLIKKLQWEYGIGMDCADYVQRSFLQVHGGTRKKCGFDKIGNERLDEFRSSNAFKQLKQPNQARPRDLLIQKDFHTVLIRDRRECGAANKAAVSDPDNFANVSDTLHVLEVNSSFGAGRKGRF